MEQRRPRVLLTLPDRPHPPDGGKRRRCAATLRALAALDVELHLAVLMAGPPLEEPLPPGVQVETVLQLDMRDHPRWRAVLVAALRRVPWQVAVRRWGAVQRVLLHRQPGSYDLVWFGATDHAVSLHHAFRRTSTVVDMDDVEVPKLRAFLALPPPSSLRARITRAQRRVELPLWAGLQRRVMRLADVVLVCSELDRSRVGADPAVVVVPNGYACPEPAPTHATDLRSNVPTVLMVGTYHYPPNVDAAAYAATQVLPRLRAAVPGARLRLVGRGVERLPTDIADIEGVEVVGAVPDVAPELARAWLSLVPVRYGGGTRVKILESFAHGVPVVSTTLGCEGLDVVDGQHLLVADSAEQLAGACARLIAEPETCASLTVAARELVVERYSPKIVDALLQQVVARVLPQVVPGATAPARADGSTGD